MRLVHPSSSPKRDTISLSSPASTYLWTSFPGKVAEKGGSGEEPLAAVEKLGLCGADGKRSLGEGCLATQEAQRLLKESCPAAAEDFTQITLSSQRVRTTPPVAEKGGCARVQWERNPSILKPRELLTVRFTDCRAAGLPRKDVSRTDPPRLVILRTQRNVNGSWKPSPQNKTELPFYDSAVTGALQCKQWLQMIKLSLHRCYVMTYV